MARAEAGTTETTVRWAAANARPSVACSALTGPVAGGVAHLAASVLSPDRVCGAGPMAGPLMSRSVVMRENDVAEERT